MRANNVRSDTTKSGKPVFTTKFNGGASVLCRRCECILMPNEEQRVLCRECQREHEWEQQWQEYETGSDRCPPRE